MLKLNNLYPELHRLIVNKCRKLDKFVLRNVNKKYFKMIKAVKIYSHCDQFAEYGYLNLLKWARANNCPWHTWTSTHAAANGHLEVLKYLHANNCRWNEETCLHAAGNGHLEVLKWLRANNCPWDKWTCANASYNGHLEVLKWAYQNGCPCTQNTIDKYDLDKLPQQNSTKLLARTI